MTGGLHQLDARDGLQQLARGIVDVVVAADVARIVIGHFLRHFVDRSQFFVAYQCRQKVGVVHHLVVNTRFATKLHVFVLVRVVAMRTGGDQLLEFVLAQRFHVGFGLLFKEQLLAHAAGWVAGTAFFAT